MSEKALDLFEQIQINLDNVTNSIVFNACAQLANDRAKSIGKKLLDEMPNNYRNENIVLTSAIDILMKFGDVESAGQVFQSIEKQHIIAYDAQNILIDACSQVGMLSRGQYIVDQIPLHIQNKKQIQRSLIDMWGKCGLVEKAENLYKSVSDRDTVTYNAMSNKIYFYWNILSIIWLFC
ncbi:unnamed protein product [Rotaria sp. Silwood2]|nr:unnamed protein product [Rotaria sp. Silwood2]